MLKTIKFEVETITPMFLAGANQEKAELRAASIKGLMRFWWRTLQAESDLDALRKKENAIFGSSDEKTGGGSSFSIRVLHEKLISKKDKFPKQNITVTSKGKSFPVNILEYLAYGTLEYKKGEGNIFTREYLPVGTKFKIVLTSRENISNEVISAFRALHMFGGIGSRSRNGFGSFHVLNGTELNNDYPAINNVAPQSYPSFAKGTMFFRTKELHATWDKALAEAGKIYRGIRSGDVKLNNKDIFETKHHYEKRQYIGSPIIVDKKEESFLERHAKPYFIKVAKEESKYRSYVLYLPSLYCSELERDRNNQQINHDTVNKKFAEACASFNEFLNQHMEAVGLKEDANG